MVTWRDMVARVLCLLHMHDLIQVPQPRLGLAIDVVVVVVGHKGVDGVPAGGGVHLGRAKDLWNEVWRASLNRI